MSAPTGGQLGTRGTIPGTGMTIGSRGLLRMAHQVAASPGGIPAAFAQSAQMTDAQVRFRDDGLSGDLVMGAFDLEPERGIASAVLLSLFTDRRARPDDALPFEQDDPRGWWGDAFGRVPLGSRLWLLHREKQTQATLNRAREFCFEALQWMVEEEIADRLEVETSYPSIGVMAIQVAVYRPTHLERFGFQYVWGGI